MSFRKVWLPLSNTTAAWVGAAEVEVAQALGLVAVAGFIDCRKCYDHVILRALSRAAYGAGLGWLGELAVDQYSSERRVRWAGAYSEPMNPVGGMPAGCPFANAWLHVYSKPAMDVVTSKDD